MMGSRSAFIQLAKQCDRRHRLSVAFSVDGMYTDKDTPRPSVWAQTMTFAKQRQASSRHQVECFSKERLRQSPHRL